MAQVLKAATPENTPGGDPAKVTEIVSEIISDIRSGGDAAVRRWSDKLDGGHRSRSGSARTRSARSSAPCRPR
jgi:histidinol dehydrogenase